MGELASEGLISGQSVAVRVLEDDPESGVTSQELSEASLAIRAAHEFQAAIFTSLEVPELKILLTELRERFQGVKFTEKAQDNWERMGHWAVYKRKVQREGKRTKKGIAPVKKEDFSTEVRVSPRKFK